MSQEIIMPLERDRQMAAQAAPAQEISMLSTISRLALDPRCDMDKLERLISLQDRMEAKTALEAFNASFAEMQCEMPSVEKRTENTHTKKMYADLDDINYAVRPVFSDGHDSGLYSWDYLYMLGERQDALWQDYLKRLEQAGGSRDPAKTPPPPPASKTGCGHQH